MQPANSTGLFVQSFARGLEVIEAFGQTPTMTLTEAAEATGLSRATVRRFLHTLVSLGYMRAGDKSFQLTPKVMHLGFAYLRSVEHTSGLQSRGHLVCRLLLDNNH